MEVVALTAPVTGDRFLKMYWTAQRIAPTAVLWELPSNWELIRVLNYLRNQFKYKDELYLEQTSPTTFIMKYEKQVLSA